MTFLVASECIWIEEWFATRGTHQPQPLVHSVHMSTESGTWGWWPLCATFNLASIHPFDTPQLDAKGLHVGSDSLLWSLCWCWRGDFWHLFFFLCYRTRDFGCYPLRLLRGQTGNGHSWGGTLFLKWGLDRGTGGMGHSSLQNPVKTLHL